jgi:hypothetical protein
VIHILPGAFLAAVAALAPVESLPLACSTHVEQRQLDFLRGDWSFIGSWLGPDGVMLEVQGETHVSTELGGCLLLERLRGATSTAPFQSLSVYSYDPAQKRFTLVHADSIHGSLLSFNGEATPDGLSFSTEVRLSRVIMLRQEYRRAGQTISVERKRQFGGETAWTTVWKATYRRKA